MNNTDRKLFLKIAHRGASAHEPENTLRSFQRAIDMGAGMIELDVRLSRDGHLVVMHDKDVDRTTNGSGLVREKTLGELKELDAGGGEQIPTLEEVVRLAKGKTGFVIELKEAGIEEQVISLIKNHSLTQDVFVVSFYEDLLKKVKGSEPEIKTGLILYLLSRPDKARKRMPCRRPRPFSQFRNQGTG